MLYFHTGRRTTPFFLNFISRRTLNGRTVNFTALPNRVFWFSSDAGGWRKQKYFSMTALFRNFLLSSNDMITVVRQRKKKYARNTFILPSVSLENPMIAQQFYPACTEPGFLSGLCLLLWQKVVTPFAPARSACYNLHTRCLISRLCRVPERVVYQDVKYKFLDELPVITYAIRHNAKLV